jgi:hypothetical protein
MATLARTAAAKVMANRPWTPEGEEELLELRASGVPLRLVAKGSADRSLSRWPRRGAESETGQSQERVSAPQLAASSISNVTCWPFSDLGDVRVESAKWTKADIDQSALAVSHISRVVRRAAPPRSARRCARCFGVRRFRLTARRIHLGREC